jgi:hypothetical protein
MRRLAIFLFVFAWSLNARASEHALVPPSLVALDTPEGEKLLAESNARVDFFRLMDSFVTQERSSYCGIASPTSRS